MEHLATHALQYENLVQRDKLTRVFLVERIADSFNCNDNDLKKIKRNGSYQFKKGLCSFFFAKSEEALQEY